jgi:hypothetical protein
MDEFAEFGIDAGPLIGLDTRDSLLPTAVVMKRNAREQHTLHSLTVQPWVTFPGQSLWDLWWTKWHWAWFLPEYFGFSLSISFHRCSITRRRAKKNNNHYSHLHHRLAQ